MYFIVYFSLPNNTYLFTKSQDVRPMFQHYKNRTIKTHILIVYYNFVKMTASPRIRTQGDSILVEHTNHSPKSLGRSINTT